MELIIEDTIINLKKVKTKIKFKNLLEFAGFNTVGNEHLGNF
jgi:hypothetical protein